jgi:hypothetical protein
MAKAGAGAYSQLQRVGNYVAPQINKAADRLNQQGMQQKQLRADDKKEQQRRQDAAKTESQRREDEFNKLGVANVDDFVIDGKTGFDNIDEANTHLAKTGIDLVSKWSNEQIGTVKGSPEWWALQNKKNAMGADFKTIKGDQARLLEIYKTNLADANNGDIDDPEDESFWEGFENQNVVPYYADDGKKYADVYERDQQGNVLKGEDGKPLPPITKKWSNVLKGFDSPHKIVHLTDTQDSEGRKRTGLVNQFLGSMGKRTKDEVTGDFTINEQTWDDTAETQFMGLVKGLQSNDRKMYSLLRQATINDKVQSTKKTGFTPADKKRVEDFLRDAVKGGYGEVTTKKVTSQTNTQRKEAAELVAEGVADRFKQTHARLTNEAAAKALAAEGKKGTKEEIVREKSKMYYSWALKLRGVTSEEEAQKILDDNGINIQINSSVMNWLDSWDYKEGEAIDIGNTTINVKDTHKMAKQFAKIVEGGSGFEYDGTYAHDVVNEEVTKADADDPLGLGI